PAHPPPSVEVRLLAQPRRFRSVNWIGIGTLFRREVKRGLKDHLDSVWGPVVANLLYLAVFGLAGAMVDAVAAERLLLFVGPGLVAFSVMNRAFEMSAASLLFDKLEGMIADVLQPPIGPLERLFAMTAACIFVGVFTAAVLAATTQVFVDMVPARPVALLVFAVLGAAMMAFAGMIGGLWAHRWEHYAMLSIFFVIPASYLSGMFYPVEALPGFAQEIIRFNPLFYAIDGMR